MFFGGGFNFSITAQVDSNDRVDTVLHKEKDTIGESMKQMKEFNGIIEKQIELNEGYL